MSVRAGYGMNSEFVNGQFFINTANAPPWGSEVRLHAAAIGPFDDPFAGTGVVNPFPITFDANAPFSPNGPYLVHRRIWNRRAFIPGTSACSGRWATTMAVSASYIGNYTTNLWDVVTGNPGMACRRASTRPVRAR